MRRVSLKKKLDFIICIAILTVARTNYTYFSVTTSVSAQLESTKTSK